MNKTECKILSIDAWRYGDKGWAWNNWFDTGQTIDIDCLNWSSRKLLKYLRDDVGILSDCSKGEIWIDDDQYNLVICDRSNHKPLFAIEYGCLI